MKTKIDFGSGYNPAKGFLSADVSTNPYLDIHIVDNRMVEIPDKSVDVIRCRNVLHHVPEPNLSSVFNEFGRTLKEGGYLIISEPPSDFFLKNQIMDIIWYRYIIPRYEVHIPIKYVDYMKYVPSYFKLILLRNIERGVKCMNIFQKMEVI